MIERRENSFLSSLEYTFLKGKSSYLRTDWEITYLGQNVELGWRL